MQNDLNRCLIPPVLKHLSSKWRTCSLLILYLSVQLFFFREFCKRMDPDLPFYYWTLNERYSEEAYASFDARPDFVEDEVELRSHPLRLHRLRHNQREDSAIFVVGRAHLPARDRRSIRQSFHRPGNFLAPPPYDI